MTGVTLVQRSKITTSPGALEDREKDKTNTEQRPTAIELPSRGRVVPTEEVKRSAKVQGPIEPLGVIGLTQSIEGKEMAGPSEKHQSVLGSLIELEKHVRSGCGGDRRIYRSLLCFSRSGTDRQSFSGQLSSKVKICGQLCLTMLLFVLGGGHSIAQIAIPKITKTKTPITVFSLEFKDHVPGSLGGDAFDRINKQVGVIENGDDGLVTVVLSPSNAGTPKFLAEPEAIAEAAVTGTDVNGLVLSVSGKAHGQAAVKAKGYDSQTLGVFVFRAAAVIKSVAAHIICDSASPAHCANLDIEAARNIISVSSGIWHQANIGLDVVSVDTKTVNIAFDGAAQLGTSEVPSVDEDAITEDARNPNVSINIYFLFDVTLGNEPIHGGHRENAEGSNTYQDIFISMAAGDVETTVAHEIGHAMGLVSENPSNPAYADYLDAVGTPPALSRKYELMYAGGIVNGRTVTPRQGNFINPVQ